MHSPNDRFSGLRRHRGLSFGPAAQEGLHPCPGRPAIKREEYWLPAWGAFDAAKLKPDSSAKAAAANPRLYVDSLIFYEETAIDFAAKGMKAVKATFGDHVWCGANYSGHPFYYPTSTMYIKWFRGGAADMGRHSEYFWQVNQLGPMINGYFAEHFRAGMRDNPKAVLRQYTMPHAPGNSDASFMRTAFSHLAHGAKMLDYFGIGMNECFTENHIDHRAHSRYALNKFRGSAFGGGALPYGRG